MMDYETICKKDCVFRTESGCKRMYSNKNTIFPDGKRRCIYYSSNRFERPIPYSVENSNYM